MPILDGVHLWTAHLDGQEEGVCNRWQRLLDEVEAARASRFYFERDRRRFTVARGILRALLARYLDAPPGALAFGYTEQGKPFLTSPQSKLHFNVSHSGGQALFAFAQNHEVGVDIEAGERLGDDWPGIARRYFSEREQSELFELPEPQRRAAFLTGWARKEAYLKATGLGISDGLQKIEVTLGPDRPAAFLSEEHAAHWAFCDAIAPEQDGRILACALVVARGENGGAAPAVRHYSVDSHAELLVAGRHERFCE